MRRRVWTRVALVAAFAQLVVLDLPSDTAAASSYTLTVTTLGSGSVSVSPVASSYPAGTVVTLTASPASGWTFSSWSGNLTGYGNPSTLVMNGNYTVTTTFNQRGYYGITGDSRTVAEPSFPLACTVLTPQQSASSLNQSLFDTSRLQAAINNCPVGQAVALSASGTTNAFLTQPITLKAGVTLLLDPEVTLFGSTNYSDYNCTADLCTPLIDVAANTALNPGSAIMGYGVIDGQGSSCWQSAIDDGTRCPRLIWVGDYRTNSTSDNFTLYKITIQNAGQFHVYAISNGFTAWGVKITAPNNSPNTDGIDPSASSNITIRDSYISDGDDHVAIKAGIGHVSNVTITHNHLYSGHGISVGSETNAGVNNVLVSENVIDDANVGGTSTNSIRIKSDSSRGGEVKDVLYQDICLQNPGHAFVFDPFYSDATGSLIPYFHDIHMQNVHMLTTDSSSTFVGYDASRVLTMTMDDVVWDAYSSSDFTSAYTSNAAFTLGPGKVNFASTLQANASSDTNVRVSNNITNTSVPTYDCTGRYTYLAGELYSKTSSVTQGSPVTLTSILQPIVSGSAAPTGTISILEGTTVVAAGPVAGRLTYLTVPSVGTGPHIYTVQYSGDANYAPLSFGRFMVTGT